MSSAPILRVLSAESFSTGPKVFPLSVLILMIGSCVV
jgi:hypothetical protein